MSIPAIQIDMFEVQLGAAILLTFSSEGDIVRVLADAGVKAGGYKKDHVLRKLDKIFGDGERRIDLIIGTHYDEDHLNGLVPIIEDETIAIGEAWMPPVANDIQNFAVDKRATADDMLARQFAGEGGTAALIEYLARKRTDIGTIAAISNDLARSEEGPADAHLKMYRADAAVLAKDMADPLSMDFFRSQLDDDEDCDGHGVEGDRASDPLVDELIKSARTSNYSGWNRFGIARTPDLVSRAKFLNEDQPDVSAAQLSSLASIKKAAAEDAINANALHEVVQALEKRAIPIRCEIIEDGKPRTYGWDKSLGRFIPAKPPAKNIAFTLLGPSRGLVKKHRELLPVMDAAKVALTYRGKIEGITESNQLSYIGVFHHQEQNILISGDAGCVDFSPDRSGRGEYYQALLDVLSPLHVVQVAHHAGANAHFYNVLAAAKYPDQKENSFLLLSHRTHDIYRPSEIFREFLLSTLGKGDDVKLLFTSEPKPEKVADYKEAVFKVVGSSASIGDIGLEFEGGKWIVTKHAIMVPA